MSAQVLSEEGASFGSSTRIDWTFPDSASVDPTTPAGAFREGVNPDTLSFNFDMITCPESVQNQPTPGNQHQPYRGRSAPQ